MWFNSDIVVNNVDKGCIYKESPYIARGLGRQYRATFSVYSLKISCDHCKFSYLTMYILSSGIYLV